MPPAAAHRIFLLCGVLLLAAGLRIAGLGELSTVLVYDEAYYGLDAASLLTQPQIPIFFPANFGREGLWMGILAPFIAIFGPTPFALRFAALLVGIMTIAALYRLARELLRPPGAIWAVIALSILYWHVHFSHIAFRANLFPFFGALAFAELLRAHRTNDARHWLIAGILLGLLAYTYIPARAWIGLAGLMLLFWLFDASRRRDAFRAGLIALVIALPLLLTFIQNPATFNARTDAVAVTEPVEILRNVRQWIDAFALRGDPQPIQNGPDLHWSFNPGEGLVAQIEGPGKPILNIPLGILFAAGVLVLPAAVRGRWSSGLILLLLLMALLPSLLSGGDFVENPNFLRGIGAVIPLALLMGAGAGVLIRLSRGWLLMPLVGLLVWGAIDARLTLTASVNRLVETLNVDGRIIAAAEWLKPVETSAIYYTYHPYEQPVIRYMGLRLDAHVASSPVPRCIILPPPEERAMYVVFAEVAEETIAALSRSLALDLFHEADAPGVGYSIYRGYTILDAPPVPEVSVVEEDVLFIFAPTDAAVNWELWEQAGTAEPQLRDTFEICADYPPEVRRPGETLSVYLRLEGASELFSYTLRPTKAIPVAQGN